MGHILCRCGCPFTLVRAGDTCHGSACCNVCSKESTGTDLIYHCSRDTFDVCYNCAKSGDFAYVIKDDQHSEKNKQTPIMFDHLKNLANKAIINLDAKTQLINEMKRLKGTQSDSFDKMVNYKEVTPNDGQTMSNGLRQDSEQLMIFPNWAKFIRGDSSIDKQVKYLNEYGLKDFYDTKVYLPSLFIVANSLNEQFQKSMKNMISDSSYKMGDKCLYTAAPVKQISRAQEKTESDYAINSFPTSAHVLDFIRCSLVYDDCDGLINGIDAFCKIIAKGEKNNCVKKILRIKNMFIDRASQKKYQNNDEWWQRYNDIKCNVLIEYQGSSMIGEVKFLLKCMIDFKKACHKFYDVTQRDELVHDMNNILSISCNENELQQQLFFIIHNSKNTTDSLAQFLISYGNKVDLLK